MAFTQGIFLKTASVATLTLALVACGPRNQQATAGTDSNSSAAAALPPLPEVQPLTTGEAPPLRYAPTARALPAAAPLGYASAPPDDRYAWIDRADLISDTIGDAPPDYGFDYNDAQPWAWQGYARRYSPGRHIVPSEFTPGKYPKSPGAARAATVPW